MEANKDKGTSVGFTPKITEWVDINKESPPVTGWYKIKTTMGEYEAPYGRDASGNFLWVVPDEKMITHWGKKYELL